MNRAIFWRLMWKEYRVQRAFWIAMVAFDVLAMLWVCGLINAKDQVQWFFSVALGIPTFYALGCTSTMFAGEYDAGTYEFQRTLPAPASSIFWSKIIFAITSILAMLVLCWLLALAFAGRSLPTVKESAEMWILFIVFTWSFIVWGVFLSLLIKRPLLAAILNGVAVAVLPFFVSLVFRLRIPSETLTPLVVFACLSILLALVDIWLGLRWFDEKMRIPPATVLSIFWSKIIFAVTSILAMLVLCRLLVLAFAGGSFPTVKESAEMWILLIIFTWSFIVWCVFLSLLIRRFLLAAILNGVAVAVLPFFVSLVFRLRIPSESLTPLVVFACLSILLALVDIWLGLRWFEEKMRPLSSSGRLWGGGFSRTASSAGHISWSESWTVLKRLTWQHWRQSSWIAIVVLAMLAPLLLLKSIEDRFSGPLSMMLCVVLLPLIGSCTFLGDQRQRNYRFFAERGIGPRRVWLSRLWPWLLIVPCLYGLLIITVLIRSPKSLYYERIMWPALFEELRLSFGYVVLSICVGQLCSMFFRSGLLAALFSVVVTFVIAVWGYWIYIWGISWWWSAAPVPVVLLLATWLRAPDWLLERGGVRGWWRPVSLLVLSAIILIAAVGFHRINGIPLVDPGFSVSEFEWPCSPEEQKTLDLLQEAGKQYVSLPPPQSMSAPQEKEEKEEKSEDKTNFFPPITPSPLTAYEIDEVNANQKIIPLLLEIGNRKDWNLRNPSYNIWEHRPLVFLLINSARKIEAEGKLDAALEQYLAALRIIAQFDNTTSSNGGKAENQIYALLSYWAARPNQTPQRIKKAIDLLEKFTADIPSCKLYVEREYFTVKKSLSTGWRMIPWERARALRLLNVITKDDLAIINLAETQARDNNVQIRVYPLQKPSNYILQDKSRYVLRKDINIPPLYHLPQGEWLVNQYARLVNHHRATMIVLALQAYKLDRGVYPKSLDELVGVYFEQLPNDPYSGSPYYYYPNGLKIPLAEVYRWYFWDYYDDWISPTLYVETPKPLLWSLSEYIYIKYPDTESIMAKYEMYKTPYEIYKIQNEYDLYNVYRNLDESYGYLYRFLEKPRSLYDLYSHGHFFSVP